MKPSSIVLIVVMAFALLVAVVVIQLPRLPNLSDRLSVGLILAETVGLGGLILAEVFSFL